MAARIYIVPVVIKQGPFGDSREPKYITDLGVHWGGHDYGAQPKFLVGAEVTTAQHNSVVSNTDVFSFPADLTTTVGGGQVQAARDALEAALIPAQNISGSDTWAIVARKVGGMFAFMETLQKFVPDLILDDASDLNLQWGSVPANVQQGTLQVAADQNYDASFITPNMQVRQVISTFSTQFGERPLFLGPIAV